MKLIVDMHFNSNGFPQDIVTVETTDPVFQQLATSVQADKTKMAAAGWANLTNIPGQPDGTRLWDVLITHSQKAAAPAELKALNLTK